MVNSANSSRVVYLALKVVPGAARNEIAGWLGDALKVRVNAPPERGKANAAVERLIAQQLELPKSSVSIVAGHGKARKKVQISGLDESEIRRKLASHGHE